jgi:hypothetical protein
MGMVWEEEKREIERERLLKSRQKPGLVSLVACLELVVSSA